MYCTQCGAKIEDDSLFCTSCGAKTARDNRASGDTVADSPGTGGAIVDQEPKAGGSGSLKSAVEDTRKRSRRRMPLVVLVALALALTSAVAFAAYYTYTQYIAPQQTASTEQTQTDQNLPGAEQEKSKQEQGDNTAADKQKAAYKLFNNKLQEYLAAYGVPRTSSFMGSNMEYACGLSFASLVDFNKDGTDELICSYCDEVTGHVANTIVEVWAYDDDSKTISLVYSGEARSATDAGISGIDLVDTGSKVLIKTMEFIPPTPPQYHYQEMGPSGFTESTAVEQRTQSITLQNGETGSESQYYEDGSPIEVAEQIFFLSPSNDDSIITSAASSWNKSATWRTPAQTIRLTNETVAMLQEAE